MSDVQYWNDTLTEEVETIQQLVDQLPSLAEMEKVTLLDKIEKRLKSAQGTKRSFKMETRLVSDVNLRKKFETQLQKLDQRLQTLSMDVAAIKSEQERNELMEAGGGGGEEYTEKDYVKAGDKMLNEAHELQNKTQDSLSNTKALVAESKEIGMATLEELQRQREVLTSIDKETDKTLDNLERAEKLVKQFAKGIATDKFIQCFAVTNCLLLVAVCIYSIIKKGKLPSVEQNKPPEPVRLLAFLRGGAYAPPDDY